jgi:2-isopropylmalate synthase
MALNRPAVELPLIVANPPWACRFALQRASQGIVRRARSAPSPASRRAAHNCLGNKPVMTRERLYLFDTTLRDGAQTTGVDFSLEDKRLIARTLDEIGIDYIEGGYPGANPTDTEFFGADPGFGHATFTAFGMTKRAGRSVANDPGFQATLQAKAGAICLVAKAWDYHVRVALGISNEENLVGIRQSIEAVAKSGREAMLDCEHFFDGYKANRAYALAVARIAHEAGARWVVLCDTNGGTLPDEIAAIVADVVKHVPGSHLGIHTHNDTENAVANSLAAVRAGARQIQGALNGLGERCGNANLISIIPTLLLKGEFADRFETSVTSERLRRLTHASRLLDEVLNRAPNRQAPYVGEAAFATKAGIHASAILKEPATYEHVPPEAVGNRRRVLVSDQAGKSNLLYELERLGVPVSRDDARIAGLLDEVKAREAVGYAYEGADASFELLARRLLGEVPRFFSVDSFRVMVEKRHNALGKLVTVSEATVRVFIDGDAEPVWSVAEGNGPVHALDQALRKDLGRYQGHIKDVELVDYKVRILTGGTEAVTRVLVESRDKATAERWFTVGVSSNIIDASFEALIDSITYKLLRSGAAGAVSAL